MRYLITGGAGFVGGAIAKSILAKNKGDHITIFDNLKRRGSEWNVAELISLGVNFIHGDVRNRDDFHQINGNYDVMIEASAEPSVHAGVSDSPLYVIDTNLGGAINCLEFAKHQCGGIIFLSTSRVYSLHALKSIPLVESPTRLDIDIGANELGLTHKGVSETFDTDGARSYYGASKLAAEIICQEYAANSSLNVIINRCGVIAGPGQFGKTDQGVFTLWVARHYFNKPLRYTGFGGNGLQVRDLLHPSDLYSLIAKQVSSMETLSGNVFNIGGGRAGSVSLKEFTTICEDVVGNQIQIDSDIETSPVDIPWYISDHTVATQKLGWNPSKTPTNIVVDVLSWIKTNEDALSSIIH